MSPTQELARLGGTLTAIANVSLLLRLRAVYPPARTAGAQMPSNKRMDQSWRGRPVVAGWHARPCQGKYFTSSRATLVMRGR